MMLLYVACWCLASGGAGHVLGDREEFGELGDSHDGHDSVL